MERQTAILFPALLLVALIIGIGVLPKISVAVTPERPVVIVPTTLGSIPSEDGLVLDPIFHTYDNLVGTFLANGYIEDQTLFVMLYNWQKSMEETASDLADLIEDAKAACGCTSVDLIAHGQGGLIAWQYIQSGEYGGDVHKLVWMGMPFAGIPGAYLGADGGEFWLQGTGAGRGLGQALLDAQARDGGFSSTFAYTQAQVPVFNELLAKPDVIEYLTFTGGQDPVYPQNPFLDNLWNNDITSLVEILHVFAQKDTETTVTGITVEPSTQPPRWPHGEPTNIPLDKGAGDGMIPLVSTESYLPAGVFGDLEYDTDHRGLPGESQADVFEALTGEAPATVVDENYPVECILFFSPEAGSDIRITDPGGDQLGKDFEGSGTLDDIDNSFYSGFDADTEYAVLINPEDGEYLVETGGATSGSYILNAAVACGEEEVITTATTTEVIAGTLTPLIVEVSPDDITIEEPPPPPPDPTDTGAPTVSIQSPVAEETYVQNEEVAVQATIEDPEGSPIVDTTYTLNSTPVNPAEPLPLEDAPLGAAVFKVSATDASGNTGSSSVSFTIAPVPADTAPPVITILHPEKFDVFARDESVFITATVIDASPLATTTYWMNGKKINPAIKLPFNSTTPFISKAAVAASDVRGNKATSSVVFLVVKSKNSCLLDIIAIFIAILYSHEYPDKPTLQQLIDNCKDHFKKKKKEWR